MPPSKPALADLQERLNYKFKDEALLREALTHSSAKRKQDDPDLEKLEFLGDRVLGLCAAEMVYQNPPSGGVQNRARAYNTLVCRTTCAAVAQSIDLGAYIIMAASEARSGGRRKGVILGDACEAVLGAIFIDGGFDAARRSMLRLWAPYFKEALEEAGADPKTALQEYAQRQRLGLPQYREVSRTGADHAPSFVVEVALQGLTPAEGTGPSLKHAQQAAAEALLIRQGVQIR